jgi:flagellar biogenesis protein FliO
MNPMQKTPLGGGKRGFWLTIGIIGLVAVSAGIVLPQMLPADTTVSQPAAPPESAQKNELAYTPPAWPEAPDPKAMITRLVLGTAIVLGLCAGTLMLSKRWLRGMPVKTSATGPLAVIDSLALGNRCHVHLVGVGKHRVLVGMDASGLKSLVPLSEDFDEALNQVREGTTEGPRLAA